MTLFRVKSLSNIKAFFESNGPYSTLIINVLVDIGTSFYTAHSTHLRFIENSPLVAIRAQCENFISPAPSIHCAIFPIVTTVCQGQGSNPAEESS